MPGRPGLSYAGLRQRSQGCAYMLSLYLLRMALSGSEALGIPHGPHGGDADRGQRPSPCLLRERNGGPGLGPAGDAPRERVRGRAGARAWWREAHLVRNRADRVDRDDVRQEKLASTSG